MIKHTLTSLAVLLVCGCGISEQEKQASVPFQLPEINEENCQQDNIKQLPDQYVAEFSSLCLRQANTKTSNPKEW